MILRQYITDIFTSAKRTLRNLSTENINKAMKHVVYPSVLKQCPNSNDLFAKIESIRPFNVQDFSKPMSAGAPSWGEDLILGLSKNEVFFKIVIF